MSTKQITQENILETIEGNDIVLLDFWASWCGPCLRFGPVFEKAAKENPDIVFGKIDTEQEQTLAANYRITSIPTLAIYREKTVVFMQPGALGAAQLKQLIQQVRELDMEQVRADIEKAKTEKK